MAHATASAHTKPCGHAPAAAGAWQVPAPSHSGAGVRLPAEHAGAPHAAWDSTFVVVQADDSHAFTVQGLLSSHAPAVAQQVPPAQQSPLLQ